MNEAAAAPMSAPLSMRMTAVFIPAVYLRRTRAGPCESSRFWRRVASTKLRTT